MDSTTPTTDIEDQYDLLLRAAEEGLILTINNSVDRPAGTGELTVEHSHDDRTEVRLRGDDGNEYQIHRDQHDLIYSRITDNELSYEDDVVSIEAIGIK